MGEYSEDLRTTVFPAMMALAKARTPSIRGAFQAVCARVGNAVRVFQRGSRRTSGTSRVREGILASDSENDAVRDPFDKLKKDERIKSIRKVASGGKRSKRGAYAHPLLGDEKARKRRTSHPVFGWGDFSPQSGCQGRRLRDQIPTELVVDLTVIPQHTDGTSIDDQPHGSPLHAHY